MKQKEHFIEDLLSAFQYWNEMIGFEALQYDPEKTMSAHFDPRDSMISLEHCSPCGGEARAMSYADPVTGLILSGKIDIYPELFGNSRGYQQNTLAHELGHILGLAHNFAATEDPENAGSIGVTSIMDYGDTVSLESGLPYDRAAIEWIYKGLKSSVQFRHCSDREVLYVIGCSSSDSIASRQTSSKDMADGYLDLLRTNPDSIKSDFLDEIDLDERLERVVQMKSRGEQGWAFEYLDILNGYLGDIYVSAFKTSSFDDSAMAQETRVAWLKVFQFTLEDPRATYTSAQRGLLELTEKTIREAPINPSTIDGFVDAYNQQVIP